MRLEIKVYRGRPVTATVLPEMSAVKHAFQFIAVMGPNQEHVAPKDLAVTVTEAFPNCKVDWEA
ncbi:MAG TPA: hypothetical protein VMM76_08925, partial [Pirellulaceae bacterium]|nr:hypothetical protein [Pirellulaceae bacterium]